MISSNKFLNIVCLCALVSIFLYVPSGVWAGTTGKIAGIVTDAKTGEPLAGVNVLLEGTTQGAATDLDGSFFIINVVPGEYSVRATMIGYTPVLQEKVLVKVDQTTSLLFSLNEAALESAEEIVVVADRPLVEKDVGASQNLTTASEAAAIPVSDIMQAVSLDPGITVLTTKYEVEVRGGTSREISFQVDGMERVDKLNDKVYTPTNSATVSEIQVLSGGFNAEYGNLRSGVFNIISKEGGSRYTGSVDYRFSPAQQKHFGPDAFGTDQYDKKIYASPSSFDEVTDIEGNTLFIGWDALATNKNAEDGGNGWMGKNDWSGQDLLDIWNYRHRGVDYTSSPDHQIDAGFGGPIPIGGQTGFFVGYKYGRISPVLPTINEFDKLSSVEAKLHFKPSNSTKLVFSGLWGTYDGSTDGTGWNNQAQMEYGYNAGSAALGRFKYYSSAYDLLEMKTTQYAAKFTHSLNPATFYEIRYNYFATETDAHRGADRNPATATTIAGIPFDEVPYGWAPETASLTDLTGTYDFSGEGAITDNSFAKSHQINLDLTTQVGSQHLLKFGLAYGMDHVVRNYHEQGAINLGENSGNFINYDEKPYYLAAYAQDKIEVGGLIANIGLRLEHFASQGVVYDPGNLYTLLWARGGTEGYNDPSELPQEDAKSFTYLAPRLSFSHPVGENTKFFFNYGVYYNQPGSSNRYGLYSESFGFGNGQGDIRRIGNANLESPRTSAYEVGFEQSIGQEWLIRAYFYSKDNTEQIGTVSVSGLDGTHAIGDFRNYEGVGKGSAGYQTSMNANYQDVRGIELKLTKRTGRFVTGWFNMNYLTEVSGDYGIQRYNQDPLVEYYAYSAVKQQPQTKPSFRLNVNLHTPHDYGNLWGDWMLSLLQNWASGPKYIYNPTGLPTREIRTVYYWVDNYTTNLRLSKSIGVFKDVRFRLYMDINNIFDYERLNLSLLSSSEQDLYLTQVVDGENGLGRDIGEYEDDNGNNVFTENWVDRNGTQRAPIAPSKDFALWYDPRSFLFGLAIEF